MDEERLPRAIEKNEQDPSIERESAERLALLDGTEPDLREAPRRRPDPDMDRLAKYGAHVVLDDLD